MPREWRVRAIIAIVLAAMASPVGAQDPSSLRLEPLVVTPSRLPGSIVTGPASTTLITRGEIERQRPASLVDLLRRVPGLHVDQPGGRGGIGSVYLRGSDPNGTVVMVDGIPLNDPTNSRGGSFDLSGFDPDNVERIEVVRGPLSAVYGSDALACAINIISRAPARARQWTVLGEAGRFDYRRGTATARGSVGAGAYAASAGYVHEGEAVEGSRFTGKSATASLDLPSGDSARVRLFARMADQQAEGFPDDSGGPRFAARRTPEERDARELVLGLAAAHEIRPWLNVDLRAGFLDRIEDVTSPGVAPGLRDPAGIPASRTDTRFRRAEATGTGTLLLSEAARLVVGTSARHERGTADGTLLFDTFALPTTFKLDRLVYGAFAEGELEPVPGLLLSAGVRADWPEGFASRTSGRLGAAYRIEETGTVLRVSWSEGFKLPSFFALGHPLVGNPELAPETSESIEIGVRQPLWEGRASLGGSLFRTA